MGFRRGLATLIVFSLAGFTFYLAGQGKVMKYSWLNDTIVCYAAPGHSDLHIGPPDAYLSRLKSSAAVNAEINIQLIPIPNFFAAQTAKKAAEIWGSLIHSDVPITIEVKFREMTGEESGVLASTLSDGPYAVYTNGNLPSRLYKAALAEKLLGRNLNANEPDMLIEFNTGFSWYYKDDGKPTASQHDFLSVLLHEMAHGLGFSGHFLVFENEGWQTYTIPGVFDHFLWSKDPRVGKGDWLLDTLLFPVPSEDLADQLQSPPIYFKGPVTKQVGGEYPKMYVPTEYNRGSSIYHLDDSYNPTPIDSTNAMMTFSSPPGEVIHDPGPLTTNMMYDIGWVHTYIDHDTLSDRESLAQPFTVTAMITGDEGILAGTQYLYWTMDGFQSKDSVLMTVTGNPDEFTGDLQVSSLETTVKYYIQTKDNNGRIYTSPPQAPESSHGFFVGEDTKPPVIDHIPIQFMLITNDSMYIQAQITDNLGLAVTQVEYKINEVDQIPVELTKDTLNSYHGYLFSPGQVNIGDQIKYRIKAVDAAVAQNTTYHPETDYHEFEIEEIPPSRDFYENDFEEGISDFLTTEFFHDKPVGFNSFGLHSEHPYKSPNSDDTYYNFYAQLRIPIRLSSDNSYMSFDEIAYIEPGEEGTVFGDDEFWDYVIIEGSKDDGQTWHEFRDGWDCRANTTWDENYRSGFLPGSNDSQAIPKEEEKQYRLINMLEDPYFQSGDIVLIRFRLLSDPYARGWGWMIDNLRIQGTTAVKDYPMLPEGINIYPVPSTGLLNVSIQMKESVAELQVDIMDLTGRELLSERFNYPDEAFTEQFDISHLPNGVYLIKFTTGDQTIVRKVILAR
jgi:hypothetical protein